MNRNIILLIASFLFSLLFYQKNVGLNYLLFSIVVILLLLIFNFKRFKKRKTIAYALCYFATSAFVFVYNSSLAFFGNIASFFVLLGTLYESKSSIYIQLLNGFYSTIASLFSYYFNRQDQEKEALKKKKVNYLYWFKMVGIPMIVLLIFVILYRSANPYFDQIIRKIDLSFVNIQWILFTLLGYFLFLNITRPIAVNPATEYDLETTNHLKKETVKKQSLTGIIQENQLGIVLLILLNMLIIFFLITDTFYLSEISKNLTAPSLSKSVHEGIYALITSIIFAIAIILYFFRGNLNFYEKNKHLKTLTIIWIVLNVALVLITAYKNYLYVSYYGFTYKRIGVFIYLFLSFFGLSTTHFKVTSIFNLWYLLRKNVLLAFLMLIISSTVNWDRIITKYNTEFSKTIDLNYLIKLSNNNTFILKKFIDANPNTGTIAQQGRIEAKYHNYIRKLNKKDWQELILDNLKLEE